MKKKIISVLLSVSMILSSAAAVFAAPSDIPFEQRILTVDTVKADTAIKNLKEDLKKTNNYNKVFEDYMTLIDLSAEINDAHALNAAEIEKLDYGIDTTYSRDELDENYNACIDYEKKLDLAIRSILDSQYAGKFKEYWGEERTRRIESISDEIDNSYKEFSDRYYELLRDNADDAEFAKLLKEIIAYQIGDNNEDSEEESNGSGRGYDSRQIYEYCQNISDYWYYVNKFKNYGTHMGLAEIKEDIEVGNPIEALSFVGKIDPRLQAAYDYMIDNNLCFYDDDGDYYVGTTYPLITHEDAEVIAAGDETVIETLIHEFGHFQSFLGTETDNEDIYFGYNPTSSLAEFESQMFELIATDYYDEIYGENADAMKFRKLVSNFQLIGNAATLTAYEMSLYNPDVISSSDEEIDEYLTNAFGEEWYMTCQFYFIKPGGYIQYSLTMFDAIQVYDMYLHDKQAGIDKYFEACSYTDGTYEEITEKLGLVSAFDENALEYLQNITDDIFKTEYDIDYATALDYFENGTYLGNVYPTAQRVSVNGGEPQTLFAYNSSGFNYIRIRDLAKLLNGTDEQFDVEYDENRGTVNIITGKPYTSDGTDLDEVPEVETAGQKAAGTYALLRDGEAVRFGGSIFVNGWNCYLLRGLAENNVLGITVDYDENNDVVLIYTE